MAEEVKENEEIDLMQILFAIRDHIVAIVLIVAFFLAAGFVYTRVEKPVYKSSGTMLVIYDGGSTAANSDYTLSANIANTYVKIITESRVCDAAAKLLLENGIIEGDTAEESIFALSSSLQKNLSVSSSNLMITVSYNYSDPETAKAVVDCVLDTAEDIVANLVDTTVSPNSWLNGNLIVFSHAKDGTKVSSTLKNLAIAGAAGVVVAAAYVFLRELFGSRFKTAEQVEKTLGLPVLSNVLYYDLQPKNDGRAK